MTEKIEQFYQALYQRLSSKLGIYTYKGIDVIPMVIRFYLNTIVNSKALIRQMEKVSDGKEMGKLTEQYFEAFFKPKGNKLKLAAQDISRYFYHKIFYKTEKSDADFLVFVTNKKFFSFVKPIKETLESQGKKVEFLLWDKIDSEGTNATHLPKTEFPSFDKNYFQYHGFTTLIDRARGFLPLLKNKKLILIEGDLEAQHILGLLGKDNNFKTYCMQWGFFGKTVTKPGWRNMPYDKLLVWGDFFAENFKAFNPGMEVVSCGHPSLKENTITEKGKVILFAVQKEFGEHITKQDVVDFIHFAARIAKEMPDYKIIVRSHPDFAIPENIRQEYQSVENIIWHDYQNFSLNQSFDDAKYCVSISSTVSLESIAYGCYPVYLKINNLPLQIHQLLVNNPPHLHVFDAGNFVSGIQQLETQNLNNYLTDFKVKLYKNLGTEAISATVSELT